MRFAFVSTVLMIALSVGLFWMLSRREAPAFALIPAEHRAPLGFDVPLPTLHGEMLRLADLQGQVVLLNVWATWCYPCRAEMPAMAALYRRYWAKGFTLIAVANDAQGRDVVGPFAQDYNLPFPILLDPHQTLTKRLNVPGLPTSYLLDQEGRIALREVGQRNWNHPDMHRLLDTLLATRKASAAGR